MIAIRDLSEVLSKRDSEAPLAKVSGRVDCASTVALGRGQSVLFDTAGSGNGCRSSDREASGGM